MIISAGRLLRNAPLAELTGGRVLRIRTGHAVELSEALGRVGAGVQQVDDARLLVTNVTAEEVAEAAFGAGVTVTELTEQKSGLEEVFLELTAGSGRSQDPVAESSPGPGTAGGGR